MRAPLSDAGAHLLHALVARSGLGRNRVFIGRIRSVAWQSLTFAGERHEIALRLVGPDAGAARDRLATGLAEVEWTLGDHLVADIAIVAECAEPDGSVSIHIEALTLND